MAIITRDITLDDIYLEYYAWVPFGYSDIINTILGNTVKEGVRVNIRIKLNNIVGKMFSTVIVNREKLFQLFFELKSEGIELKDDDLYLYKIKTNLQDNMTNLQIRKLDTIIADKKYEVKDFDNI